MPKRGPEKRSSPLSHAGAPGTLLYFLTATSTPNPTTFLGHMNILFDIYLLHIAYDPSVYNIWFYIVCL